METVTKIFGSLSLEFDVAPSKAFVTDAVCAALLSGTNCDYVTDVSSKAKTASINRLLLVDDLASSDHHRRLGTTYDLNYTVAVANAADVANVVAKARDLGDPNSTTIAAFTKSFRSNGVTVSNIIQTQAPLVTTSIILKDKDGKVIGRASSSTAAAIAPEEEGSNVAALIGGIIGGLVGLTILVGAGYFLLVLRRKAEA